MTTQLRFMAQTCNCCVEPAALLPRLDLPGDMAVCPQSGQLYRPAAGGYVAAQLPDLRGDVPQAPSVRINLSQAGYA